MDPPQYSVSSSTHKKARETRKRGSKKIEEKTTSSDNYKSLLDEKSAIISLLVVDNFHQSIVNSLEHETDSFSLILPINFQKYNTYGKKSKTKYITIQRAREKTFSNRYEISPRRPQRRRRRRRQRLEIQADASLRRT